MYFNIDIELSEEEMDRLEQGGFIVVLLDKNIRVTITKGKEDDYVESKTDKK